MSSMGEMNFFLGLKIEQSKEGILIHQEKYVHEILEKFQMVDCKSASTPILVNDHLSADLSGPHVNEKTYRSMIGSLMYLTASRPDITFAVSSCSRYQASPRESHDVAVKRILRYLKGKPRLGLWYPHSAELKLFAFSDSDFGGCGLDRKSSSGACQYLGERLVAWQCKKQTVVSISTTEAEYYAASSCCSQVVWIKNQLLDFGLNFLKTPIYCDNESVPPLVRNPIAHSRSKHMDIRMHFIRDCHDTGLVDIKGISSTEQRADIFTKAFDRGRFEELVKLLGLINFNSK